MTRQSPRQEQLSVQFSPQQPVRFGSLTNISSGQFIRSQIPVRPLCAHFQRRIQVLTADVESRARPQVRPSLSRMDSTQAGNASSDTAELAQIRALLRQRNFAAVLEAQNSLLARIPLQAGCDAVPGIAQRYLGRIPDALKTLADLGGIIHASPPPRGAGDIAMSCWRQARRRSNPSSGVNITTHCQPVWSISKASIDDGASAGRQMAASQVAALRNIPPEIVTATSLHLDGDWTLPSQWFAPTC